MGRKAVDPPTTKEERDDAERELRLRWGDNTVHLLNFAKSGLATATAFKEFDALSNWLVDIEKTLWDLKPPPKVSQHLSVYFPESRIDTSGKTLTAADSSEEVKLEPLSASRIIAHAEELHRQLRLLGKEAGPILAQLRNPKHKDRMKLLTDPAVMLAATTRLWADRQSPAALLEDKDFMALAVSLEIESPKVDNRQQRWNYRKKNVIEPAVQLLRSLSYGDSELPITSR